VAADKATENCLFQDVAVEKLPSCADQTRSTRDILHLIQSRATDESSRPVSDTSTSSKSSVSNGLRQFQVRPQLFEAIMMPPTSTDKLNCEQNSSSLQTEQSATGLILSV